MKEIKLNSTVEINGVTYKCIKGDDCSNCDLNREGCNDLLCALGARKDKTDIVFKKVNNKDKYHYIILGFAIVLVAVLGVMSRL